MSEGVRHVTVTRVGRRREATPAEAVAGEGAQANLIAPASQADWIAIEEPLEVRLHGRPFAVVMRTPGADRELAAGFLLAEGVISSSNDLGAVEHCKHPDHPDRHNVVDVFLLGEARRALDQRFEDRRHVVATSSCGVCGRLTIESLRRNLTPLSCGWTLAPSIAASLPVRLRSRQRLFDETGGLHAAGLFTADGTMIGFAEDVGRHNAVDKVVGRMLLDDRLPLGDAVLAVSGRTSFEILQKAWLAGVAIVCAVSAPSSLAVELAESAGITLLGFVRDGGFNIYSHGERVRGV